MTAKKQTLGNLSFIPEIRIKVEMKRGKEYDEAKGISNPQDMANVMRTMFDQGKINWVEECVMLCLNYANKVVGYHRISSGGVTASVMDVRVIATVALTNCATSVAIAHNHPSGNLTPSEPDKQITRKLRDGLRLLDIQLLDHLIITDNGYFSFAEEGYFL